MWHLSTFSVETFPQCRDVWAAGEPSKEDQSFKVLHDALDVFCRAQMRKASCCLALCWKPLWLTGRSETSPSLLSSLWVSRGCSVNPNAPLHLVMPNDSWFVLQVTMETSWSRPLPVQPSLYGEEDWTFWTPATRSCPPLWVPPPAAPPHPSYPESPPAPAWAPSPPRLQSGPASSTETSSVTLCLCVASSPSWVINISVIFFQHKVCFWLLSGTSCICLWSSRSRVFMLWAAGRTKPTDCTTPTCWKTWLFCLYETTHNTHNTHNAFCWPQNRLEKTEITNVDHTFVLQRDKRGKAQKTN